jgi:hypothetical protein
MKLIISLFIILILLSSFGDKKQIDIKVMNLKGQSVTISSDNQLKIIVFSKLPVCHDCFVSLNKALKNLKKDTKIEIDNIIFTEYKDITDRKKNLIYFKKILDADNNYFETASDKEHKSVIDRYKIKEYPSVLLFKNGKSKVVTFGNTVKKPNLVYEKLKKELKYFE